jgi:hypothetical protein
VLRIETTEERPLVMHQTPSDPNIYLDHWAIRKISEDAVRRKTFVTRVKRCGGSVALSWLNFLEFTRVSDCEQQRKAGALFDELYT